jgi:hypothetical protein
VVRENRRTSRQVGPLLKITPNEEGQSEVTANAQFVDKQGGVGSGPVMALGCWVGCADVEEACEEGRGMLCFSGTFSPSWGPSSYHQFIFLSFTLCPEPFSC